MISGCPNRFAEASNVIVMTNTRTGRSMGRVMLQKRLTEPAPSIAAASYRETGMSWSAARMMMVLKPMVHQSVAIVIAIQASGIVLSHEWGVIPSPEMTLLIKPWLWKSHHQTMAAAVTDSVYGAKKRRRKNPRPRKRPLSSTARNTARMTRIGTLQMMNWTVLVMERQKFL